MSYQPNRCADGRLVVPWYSHELSIAIEATASHTMAELTLGRTLPKARWWNAWAKARTRYRWVMETGGMFPR